MLRDLGFTALAPAPTANANLVSLGRDLFYEARLAPKTAESRGCFSCHGTKTYGVNPTIVRRRNVPTVFNLNGQKAFYWDGRAATLEVQATMAMTNPDEMGHPNVASADAALAAIAPDYKARFKDAFGDEAVSLDRAATSIAAYEKQLVTPAPIDDALTTGNTILTAKQEDGASTFAALCSTCHNGPSLRGDGLRKGRSYQAVPDLGRFDVTGNDADKFLFAVPGLRNVEKTAPYFHDGSAATLKDAITYMAENQAQALLSPEDVENIAEFLKTLTGSVPEIAAAKP